MVRQRRVLSLFVLACALFLRLWVPAGFMPAPGGGLFALAPCPAAGAVPLAHAAGHDHGRHVPSHPSDHDGACAFALLAASFAHSDPSAPALAPGLVVAMPVAHRQLAQLQSGPPALPPPATGPPLRV